jgi:hypothetical protein
LARYEKHRGPAKCIGCETHAISGSPDPKHISSSYIERQNLSVRMTNRRFTRLTNAFSKKIENHMALLRPATSYTTSSGFAARFRVTPAMAAGVTDRLWDVEDLVVAWEASERRTERQAAKIQRLNPLERHEY